MMKTASDKKVICAKTESAGFTGSICGVDKAGFGQEMTGISVPVAAIPKGAQLVEAYETATEIIVCGWPDTDDESHDCDAMGCSSVSHVLHRFRKGK